MSLNSWSLVYFAFQSLFMIGIGIAMFSRISTGKFLFAVLAWLVQLSSVIIYGMATNQLGFVLLFFVEIILLVVGLIVIGKNDEGN